MGLLLGASVITLFELLDVIFYNLAVKLTFIERRRKRASHGSPTTASSNSHTTNGTGDAKLYPSAVEMGRV